MFYCVDSTFINTVKMTHLEALAVLLEAVALLAVAALLVLVICLDLLGEGLGRGSKMPDCQGSEDAFCQCQ